MRVLMTGFIAVFLGVSLMLCACTTSEDPEREKGTIEQMTERAGQKMAQEMKKPIDKAKDVKQMTEQLNREREKEVDNY